MENQTQTLPKVVSRRSKRLGRGYGSGKGGHTSSRGQKGQKVRSSIPLLFEGYKAKKSLLRRLPQLRGKAKFHAKAGPVVVKLSDLNALPGGVVTIEVLAKNGLVDLKMATKYGVKIIGKGKMEKVFETELPMSKGAAKLIESQKSKKKTK